MNAGKKAQSPCWVNSGIWVALEGAEFLGCWVAVVQRAEIGSCGVTEQREVNLGAKGAEVGFRGG